MQGSFYGWYMKCQSDTQTLAVIPAVHQTWRVQEKAGQSLKAPTRGDMVRTIHESAACRASYQFRKKGCTIFSFETDKASFEYEWDK